jgi:hypothetical protein
MIIKEFMIPTVPTRHRQMMKPSLDRIGRFPDWYTEVIEKNKWDLYAYRLDIRDEPDYDPATEQEVAMELIVKDWDAVYRYRDFKSLMTSLDLDEDEDRSLCNKLLNLYPHQREMMELFNDNHGVIQNQINAEFKRLLKVYKILLYNEIMMRETQIDRDETPLYDELSIIMPIRRDCPRLWYEYARMCNNMIATGFIITPPAPKCKGCNGLVNERSRDTGKWWDYCNKCYEDDQDY